MSEAFSEGELERGHIDLVLKAWLASGNTAQRVGACYINPQMCGDHSHASGCDPFTIGEDRGGRPSAWAFENPGSGTRVATDPKQRGKYLIQWMGAGQCPSGLVGLPNGQGAGAGEVEMEEHQRAYRL